jgi:tryptophan synthase beta chain
MGEKDTIRQSLNVQRMKLLGAKVHSVTKGTQTLSDACDAAIEFWLDNYQDTFYIIGSVVGPHPYPKIVRFFQSIIGVKS